MVKRSQSKVERLERAWGTVHAMTGGQRPAVPGPVFVLIEPIGMSESPNRRRKDRESRRPRTRVAGRQATALILISRSRAGMQPDSAPAKGHEPAISRASASRFVSDARIISIIADLCLPDCAFCAFFQLGRGAFEKIVNWAIDRDKLTWAVGTATPFGSASTHNNPGPSHYAIQKHNDYFWRRWHS